MRDLVGDSVCGQGHVIDSADDTTEDGRCLQCVAEMKAERRRLTDAVGDRAARRLVEPSYGAVNRRGAVTGALHRQGAPRRRR